LGEGGVLFRISLGRQPDSDTPPTLPSLSVLKLL
jgi:hypothetical protein